MVISNMARSCLTAFLILFTHKFVCADLDLVKLFGSNVNNEDAWAKLFELEKCPKPQRLTETIIMVNESLAAGAQFLGNPNVTSRFECEFECCYKRKGGCNVAVYAGKQKSCFIFDCGTPSKCRFDQHTGFTVSIITEVISSEKKTTPLLIQTTTTEAASTTAPPPKNLHLLDGCRPGVDKCVTDNTECSNTGYCMCKKGFHPKNGVCRKDCLHGLQFECTNGDAKYAQPDCIAVYDVCDGTPQCSDGSDEKDCKKDDKFDWSKLGEVGSLKSVLEDYIKEHAVTETTKSPATTQKTKPSVSDIKALLGQKKPGSDNKAPADGESKQDGHESQLNDLKSSDKPVDSSTPSSVITVVKSSNKTVSGAGNEAAVDIPDAVDIAEDKTSRSAVIALSLSLTLTVVLLVYLVCRYKNMKSKMMRRGKPLRGSEVDYLIDGMYL